MPTSSRRECFVIMPISDPTGYDAGHFREVLEEVLRPSCTMANLDAVRADDVAATNLIHLDILQRLLRSPIALCDLSGLNANVMFELGMRQAFEKPVVLVCDDSTPRVFDIAPIRTIVYKRSLRHSDVRQTQDQIASALRAAGRKKASSGDVNSIASLLKLVAPATATERAAASRNPQIELVRADIAEIRRYVVGAGQYTPMDDYAVDALRVLVECAESQLSDASVDPRTLGAMVAAVGLATFTLIRRPDFTYHQIPSDAAEVLARAFALKAAYSGRLAKREPTA